MNTDTASIRRKLTRYHRAKGGSATTPPDRAAAHIAHLRQHGMIDRDIRAAAHIAEPTLYRAARRQGAISRDTEARILAVQPATVGRARSLATIPPHSTRRRLQALVHAGWPPPTLAARSGMHLQHIHELLHRTEQPVAIVTAVRILALFAALWNRRPETDGIRPAQTARARQLAARHSWHPIAVWDNLGDPDAQPQYGELTSRQRAVVEDAEELAAEGLSREGIAVRLGIQWEAVRQAFRRAGVPLPGIEE